MDNLQNCWEFKKCERMIGGKNCNTFGMCPSSINVEFDGTNRGKNGGRYCWRIAGTLCDGKIQGTFASKGESCIECDFFKKVVSEEKNNFKK